jgi:hypothetical protein
VVELVRVVEPGCVVHRHFGTEAAIAQVGPVADFAIANARDICEAVAGEIGEVDALRPVGEYDARAFFLVQCLRDALRWPETFFGQRSVPDTCVVFGDQHVGMAVAVEIDKLGVRVAQVAIQT